MSAPASPTLEFHLPEGQNYRCTQCGRSCGMFLEVSIEERSERRLDGVELASLMPPELRHLPPFHESIVEDNRRVIRRHNGTCVFQCTDGLCGIHKERGYEVKPQTCKDFPYRFAETPGGIYVGLSFACTAVQENTGTPVADQLDELSAHYPIANSKRDAEGPVRLTSRHEITWPAYLALEADLAALLRVEGRTVAEALVAQSVYLDLYGTFLREVRSDTLAHRDRPLPGESGRFPGASGSSGDEEVLATLRRRFIVGDGAELFRIASRIRSSPALQRSFIGLITAFRQNLNVRGRKPTRAGTMARITRHYMKHAMRLGRIELEALGKPFPYEAFRNIAFVPDEVPEQRELLARYLTHRLFRKDLLLEENAWLGQRFLVMHHALLRWHATGRAHLAGRNIVALEDLREAVRDVELQYGYHSTFGKLFERFPMLGMVLDSIVRRPVFVATMAGPALK